MRPTLSDITVIRLSVLATLLTNGHDNTKLISWRRSINGDAVDCKSATFGYDWFDPSSLHQYLARSYNGYYTTLSKWIQEFDSPTSRQFCGKESKRSMGKLLSKQ